MSKRKEKVIWDYDIQKIDFQKPESKIWYLQRKLMFGDLSGLSKKDLKKYLPKLNIDPSLKELLTNFLKKYA